VILVEPSYLGVTSDVAAIARVAHGHGAALLCDQAWGGHFAFHPALPACAVTAGADLVVMSGHKTLTAFSQGAMLHAVDRGLVDLDRLDASFEALMTTSASGLIHASLDQTRALMERQGADLVEAAIELAERFRARIDGFLGARCLDRRLVLAHPSVHDVDPLKLVVDLTGTGADGFEVERDLRGDGVVLEMADRTTLVPLLTVGDDRRSVDRLVDALRRSLTRRAGTARSPAVAGVSWRISPRPVLSPRDAFFAPHERVPAAAAGRVAAETISPYPPGIPAIAPGELLTAELLDALRDETHAGSRMAGASDPTLATLLVVRS
jgi:arginine decarboxylase